MTEITVLPATQALSEAISYEGIALPRVIENAGKRAAKRFLEFFTAEIRNPNTRRAYANAIADFLTWCEGRGVALDQVEPMVVAAYVEMLSQERSAPTVKQHLAAVRMLFNYLVVGQIVPSNPAAAVRGPAHKVKKGKTPVLNEEEARALLESIDVSHVVGLRDRALLGLMTYSFARVTAVVQMKVKDYYVQGRRAYFVLHEKGGKHNRVPAHHKASEYVEEYLDAGRIGEERGGWLFRTVRGRQRVLQPKAMSRVDVFRMIKRRAQDAGLPPEVCCHTFRATGITNYLQHGGTIEKAAQIAGHESTRTTQLYDRTDDEVTLDEIERIRI